jgi:outer membrane protein OmpA-like peptidoglycan-associated protein
MARDDPAREHSFRIPGAKAGGDHEVALGSAVPGSTAGTRELAELRELLLGGERRQLEELRRRLDTFEVSPDEMAEHLPEAIALRASRDGKLAHALAPTIEGAISESVRRNPREIATAIFPVLGPAIRKAIAETMAGLVDSINHAIEHSLSFRGLRWRLEAWRTGVPFAEVVIKHALVYRVEQVFLVHAETGLLLMHVPDDTGRDADVISGMLTAIGDFVSDSFAPRATGELRTFSVDDLCVLVETGPRAYVAAVVRGVPPASLRDRLARVLESIHLQWTSALMHFDGDAAPFAGTQSLLEECLETVLSTDRARATHGVARFAWLIPVILVLGVGTALFVRSNQRWSRAVATLEQEPGIVLVRADRGWGGWRFSGLRDPLAASPAALLARVGADTTSVDARWEPYVSTQPSLVLERARRILSPPSAVALTLVGDTLVARGRAPRSWRERAMTIASTMPGVAHADLSGLTETISPELEALRRAITEQRVLFPAGSAVLDSAGRLAADTIAASLTRLRSAAGAEGFATAVVLVGRTDTLGTDSVQLALGRNRAVAVRAALLSAGLPPESIDVRSLGATDPLPATDAGAMGLINRSVSLEVTVSDSTSTPAPRDRTGAQ